MREHKLDNILDEERLTLTMSFDGLRIETLAPTVGRKKGYKDNSSIPLSPSLRMNPYSP